MAKEGRFRIPKLFRNPPDLNNVLVVAFCSVTLFFEYFCPVIPVVCSVVGVNRSRVKLA
jgi:hypothetical protein